jgi:uncharacterized membrane protein
MTKYAASFGAIALIMVALDVLWIGVIAKPLYQDGIGHLMAQNPRLSAAALFYAVYALGLLLFVVLPSAEAGNWHTPLMRGALFGFFAYATYDLTNLATLKDWPIGLSALDMAWGSIASAAAAVAGHLAYQWVK